MIWIILLIIFIFYGSKIVSWICDKVLDVKINNAVEKEVVKEELQERIKRLHRIREEANK